MTAESLAEIHRQLDGLGYVPPFSHSKNLRDAETGVKIEFLITGGFPGDGKPKPVAFPNPADVAVESDGIRYVNLPTLVELKIASGMTSTDRLKDLSDVQELIKIVNLPNDYSQKLNPFVRAKYDELWRGAHPTEKRYVTPLQTQLPVNNQNDLNTVIASLETAMSTLKAMLSDGVTLDPDGAYLVTTDPAVAKKYDMHDESELMEK